MLSAPWKKAGCRLIALVLIVSIAGCGWKVTPPKFEGKKISTGPIADSVVLTVNEGSVVWGGGELGAQLRRKLLEEGAFRTVHYPIIPRNPPPYRLTVTASGNIEEEVGLGIVKSVIIGLLFFIPVGIIRFHRDFVVDANIAFLKEGKTLHRFKVSTKTGVSHTLFSHADQYDPVIRKVAAEDLALRIVKQLASLSPF